MTEPASPPIFWLIGFAETGRSTVSRTITAELSNKGQLGATFFFRRGDTDRGSINQVVSTLATQLVRSVPAVLVHVVTALINDPDLGFKAIRVQFEKLILHPLQKISDQSQRIVVLVLDALDESNGHEDIKLLVDLFTQLQHVQSITVRILLTSRPELCIRRGFKEIFDSAHQDLILHDIPHNTIEHDMSLCLKQEYEPDQPKHSHLPVGWPERKSTNF